MNERVYTWVYGLVYPGFLGAFIFCLLQAGPRHPSFAWGVVFAVYFTMLHGEGAIAKENVPPIPLLADLLGVVVMVALFVALGMRDPLRVEVIDPVAVRALMAIALALPTLARIADKQGRSDLKKPFYRMITAAAATGCVACMFYPHPLALIVIVALLGGYVVALGLSLHPAYGPD